jgi:KDO2-lipid IV(A) lauroyltransferase
VEVFPALTDFPTRDLLADTARGSALVEDFVKLAPEQYFWVHKRFKSRPPGHPPAY